jgi:hypothetical protein
MFYSIGGGNPSCYPPDALSEIMVTKSNVDNCIVLPLRKLSNMSIPKIISSSSSTKKR